MKTKKIIALLMVLVMLSGLFTTCVWADDSAITVYLTVSNQGILGQALDGSIMAKKAVEVSDLDESGTFTVSEALVAAHSAYNTEDGYDDSAGYATKLWGIESSNTLFFVNDKGIPNGVRVDTIEDGDFLVASINKDNVTYSDWYTYFNIAETTVEVSEEFVLNLNGFLGMTYPPETATAVALADISASLWKDGTVERIEDKVTDENGQVALSFDEPGVYYVTADGSVSNTVTDYNLMNMSTEDNPAYGIMDYTTFETQMAYTEEDYGDGPYPAEEVLYIDFNIWKENQESYHTLKSNQLIKECPIIAPVCEVTVKEDAEIEILHSIAEKYTKNDFSGDVNMPWLVCDLVAYKNLYPDTENILSNEQIQSCVDKIIADVNTTESPNSLARDIITLRALGYDARSLYTENEEKLDAVAKLTKYVDEKSAGVTNTYALPYIIIALQQGEGYATEEQINYLLDYAVTNKAAWHDTQWGTDAITPMLLALAPYYNTNADIKEAIDEAVLLITDMQADDGSLGNAASTGLAIVGFSALGTDAQEVVKVEDSLIDGLMKYVSEENDGFIPIENSFSTEQGFRGLIAWQLLKSGKCIRVYEFAENPMNEAKASKSEEDDNTEGGEIGGDITEDTITVSIKVMIHDENDCDNSYTYRKNKNKYDALINEDITVSEDSSVYDALIQILEEKDIEYVEKSKGYISSINGIEEFEHGSDSGWMFLLNGEITDSGCQETEIKENDEIIWFYTDDYSNEEDDDNESIGRGSGGRGSSSGIKSTTVVNTSTNENKEETITGATVKDTLSYNDVSESDWYYEYVKYVTENGLMNGTENGFEPDEEMTRAMLVTVLYRMEEETTIEKNVFEDVGDNEWYSEAVYWAAGNGIVNGVSEHHFAPDENITREQMAVMLYRYAEFKGYGTEKRTSLDKYSDANMISDWAVDAFEWANANEIINGISQTQAAPQENATRAQVSAVLTRFCKEIRGN